MSGIRTKRLITELTRLKANEDIINSVAIIDGKLDHWKVKGNHKFKSLCLQLEDLGHIRG